VLQIEGSLFCGIPCRYQYSCHLRPAKEKPADLRRPCIVYK
jgi:hypothetical protein